MSALPSVAWIRVDRCAATPPRVAAVHASRYAFSVTASARKPSTLDDLAILRDRGLSVELIDGEIVHKAVPKPEHGAAQTKFGGVLSPFNRKIGGARGPGGWWIMSEVEVLYADRREAHRHDVVGFRRDRFPSRPTGLPVRERADWVSEILSPSTARYDIVQKQRTLHAHGVCPIIGSSTPSTRRSWCSSTRPART